MSESQEVDGQSGDLKKATLASGKKLMERVRARVESRQAEISNQQREVIVNQAQTLAVQAVERVEAQAQVVNIQERLLSGSQNVPTPQSDEAILAGLLSLDLDTKTGAITPNRDTDFLQALLAEPFNPHRPAGITPLSQADQAERMLADMLQLDRAADGSLSVRTPVAVEAQPPVTPAIADVESIPEPAAPEQLLTSDRTVAKREAAKQALLVRQQQEMFNQMLQDIERENREQERAQQARERDERRAEKRALQEQQRQERRTRVHNRIERVKKNIKVHVSGKGLAKAAIKIALPVGGAMAMAQMGGQDQIITSAAFGATLGLISTNPIREISQAWQSKKFGRASLKRLKRSLAMSTLATLTAVSIAHDAGAFKPLGDIPRAAEAAASVGNEFSQYAPAELAYRDPSTFSRDILQGKLPLSDLYQVNSVPVVVDTFIREKGEVPVDVIAQTPALPIIYVDRQTGQELFRYQRAIMSPIDQNLLPQGFVDNLNAIEELPKFDNGAPNDEQTTAFLNSIEQEIGPLETTSADVFLARLTKRNVWDRIRYGSSAASGASTVDAQMFKEWFGYAGESSIYNPDIHANPYNTEKYNIHYFISLAKAIRKGEVIDPATLQSSETNSFVEPDTIPIVAKACEQLERFMYGKLIAQRPDFVMAYLNNIRMGAIHGREIIGIEGASEVFFGAPTKDLSPAKQIILLSSIPQISKVIHALDLQVQIRDLRQVENRTEEQQKDLTELEAAQASLGYTVDDLKNAALGNVKEAEKNHLFSTPEDEQKVLDEINTIFSEDDFFMKIPKEFDNNWVTDDAIRDKLREEIEAPLLMSRLEFTQNKDFTISRNGVVVKVDLPTEPEAFELLDTHLQFRSENTLSAQLKSSIEAGLEMKEVDGIKYYEVVVDGHTRKFPAFETSRNEFVPGLGAVVVDQSGEIIAKFDETGGILVDLPIQVGSTMKPVIYAFGRYIGAIKGPGDMTNDTPGFFSTSDNSEVEVVNAMPAVGKITWARALAESRNVPFMRFMHSYLYDGTNTLSPAEKKAEVTRRMEFFQSFIKQNYGIKVVTNAGEEIHNPQDPNTLSDLFPIGTDAYITAAENDFVDGRIVTKKSSLGAMAGLFLHIEMPEKFFENDAKLIKINHEIPKIMKNLGMEGSHFRADQKAHIDPKLDESWAKTGTVFTGLGTTGTLTAFVVRKGDEVRITFVHSRGQTIEQVDPADPVKDLTHELDQDKIAEATGLGPESYLEAHPYAKWLSKEALKLHAKDIVPAEEIVTSLQELIDGKRTDLPISVLQLTAEADVVNGDGAIVSHFGPGTLVDTIGNARDGMQPVAVMEPSKPNTIITGFIKIDALAGLIEADNTEVRGIMTSEEVQQFIDTDHFFANQDVKIVIVDKNSSSPAMVSIFKEMQTNNDLVTTSDFFTQIFPEKTLIINGDRLQDFIKERSPGNDALLARELMQAAVQLRLQDAVHRVDPAMNFDTLVQDRNSPGFRILELLARSSIPGNPPTEQLALLQLPMVSTHPMAQDLARLREIESDFDTIQRAARFNQTPDSKTVARFNINLRFLNHAPTPAEENFLALETTQ